jgi:peroxiredoxin
MNIGAAAFLFFLAAVVIAVIWMNRHRESLRHETLRLLIEKDPGMAHLESPHVARTGEPVRNQSRVEAQNEGGVIRHVLPRGQLTRHGAWPCVAAPVLTALISGTLPFASEALGALASVPTPFAAWNEPQNQELIQKARETLEAAAQAYRSTPAMQDTLTYTVKSAGAVQPPKKLEILLGSGHDVAVKDPLLEAIAVDDHLFVTKSDAPGKYVVRPYSGDLAEALVAIVGAQGSLFEPVQIAMRSGKGLAGWLSALQFKLLGPLKISGYERKTGAGGKAVDVVSFTSDNGELELAFDATSRFLSHVSLRARPSGAPADMIIEVQGSLSPKVLKSGTGLVTFDPNRLVAVADLGSLDSAELPMGGPAPHFKLDRLTGGTISLADLRGSVVVLDFWATWCVPCWKMLHETQHFAAWASQSGLPIVVLAVNTLEQLPTPAAKRDRAGQFFRSQGLTMPCLLDFKDEIFKAFGNPGLPSTVLIAPDGTILKYHWGIFPNALETLKGETLEASRVGKD